MRFVLAEDHWMLDALFPGEWDWVRELPSVASGESFRRETRERLLPPPLAPDEIADESTLDQIEDWDELIRPELAAGFSDARTVVAGDLAKSEEVRASDEGNEDMREVLEDAGLLFDLPPLRRVAVPHGHTEAWYSTLNQARILMNEEYGLADPEEREFVKVFGTESMERERLLLLAQYELYSVVQSILVENLMEE